MVQLKRLSVIIMVSLNSGRLIPVTAVRLKLLPLRQ
nr:MAG TPA: hypothetical protein [Caudoviricetes sp.]